MMVQLQRVVGHHCVRKIIWAPLSVSTTSLSCPTLHITIPVQIHHLQVLYGLLEWRLHLSRAKQPEVPLCMSARGRVECTRTDTGNRDA